MQHFAANPVILAPRARLAAACAAFGASAFVVGSLGALFGAASADPWLPDTPAAVALSATCEPSPSRLARVDCMHQAVSRWQAADRQGERVASSR